MWLPTIFETRNTTLDFRSSGQKPKPVSQLFVDSLLVCNAIELTDWNKQSFQMIVCEHCGQENCQPGNWLSLRRAGDFAIFLPRFDAMLDNAFALSEYRPPEFIVQNGSLLLTRQQFSALARLIADLPEFNALAQLSGPDAVRLLQLETAYGMLGEFPADAAIRQHAIIACSNGEADQWLEQLQAAIRKLGKAEAVGLRTCDACAQPVDFFLDSHEKSAVWTPICIENGAPALLIASDFVLEEVSLPVD